jgi:tungstate transport system substrate-binding protein
MFRARATQVRPDTSESRSYVEFVMKHCLRWLPALSLLLAGLGAALPAAAQPANPELILATTTSTQDSGLLDVLVPMFQQQTGYQVKTISVGTGQALALGERGEADVVLVHAPESEKKWMEAGHGMARRLVMFNDFVVIGPAADPGGIAGSTSAVEVMQRIAANGVLFISRGDNSGTHQLELQLWRAIGFDPKSQPWYQEVGQGMGQTLTIANDKQAYTLTDRGTYLARRQTMDLQILAEGYQSFLNVYHVMPVNPAKGPHINAEGGRAFAEFLTQPETQLIIAGYGVDRFGQPLFFPAADKTDEELGV